MAGTDSKSDHMADPRRWAEDPIGSPDEALSDLSLEEARGLIYELRIHETELMMQNEQLRRSQEKLQDSVEQYTDLYDFAPVGYITLGGRGIITEANLTVAEMLRMDREHLINKPLGVFIAEEDQGALFLHLLSVRESRTRQSCEVRYLENHSITASLQRPAPSWFLLESIFIEGKGPDASLIRTTLSDITDRKRTEENFRESEAKIRYLFEIIADPILAFDMETRCFVNVNSAAEELYGYSTDEFLQMTHFEITAEPEDSDRSIRALLNGENARISRRLHRKKDGTIFPVEMAGYILETGERKVVYGIVRDITERELTNDALQESEERFRQMEENIRSAFWLTGLYPYEVIYMSPAYEEIWGRPVDSLYGHPQDWSDFIHPEDRELAIESFRNEANNGAVLDIEYRVIRPDGEVRWIQDRSFPRAE